MPPRTRDDPYGAHSFELVIEGVSEDGKSVSGSFAEVSGIETDITPIEYRNGSEDIRVRKIPGLKKYSNLTLKRGVSGHTDFWKWIEKGLKGKVQRANGAVILLDENREEVMRWTFERGWACKYTGPGLNAKNNEIAMETLEVCHEGIRVDV